MKYPNPLLRLQVYDNRCGTDTHYARTHVRKLVCLTTGRCFDFLLPTRQGVLSIAMSNTGDICFSGSLDSTICAWQLPSENVDPFDAYSKALLSCTRCISSLIDSFFFFAPSNPPLPHLPPSIPKLSSPSSPPHTHYQTLISTMQYLRGIQMQCGTLPYIQPVSAFSPVLLMGLAASGTTSHPTPS